MTVPEATINKYCNPLLWKDKIRVSLNIIVTSPATDSELIKHLDHLHFSGLIASGLDLFHYLRSLIRRKDISHIVIPILRLNRYHFP